MPKVIFPDPAVKNPWTDDNGQVWDHDTMGWIARSSTSGGGGDLPPVPPYVAGNGADVLTARPDTGELVWENFDAGEMLPFE